MNRYLLSRDSALVMAASFFYMASPMLVTPLIAGFSESLGASATFMGLIAGAMNLCSMICRPFAGNLADKLSKYQISTIGSGLMMLACIGYLFVHSLKWLFVIRILNGIGYSCCSVCISTWMAQLLPQNRIGAGMGLYGTMNALAMAFAPSIGIVMRNRLGYRAAFVCSVVFSCCVLMIVQLVHDKGEPAEEQPNLKMQLIDIHVLPYAATIMCFTIPYCATQSFLVSYVENRLLDVPVAYFFSIYAAFLLVLRLLMKDLFDRWRFWHFLIIGSCSEILALICLQQMNGIFLMIAAAFFMAGGYGIMCSVCQSASIIAAGPGRKGLANSTYYIGFDLGMTFGPVLGGLIFGLVPLVYFFLSFLLVVPICWLLYLLLYRIFIRK